MIQDRILELLQQRDAIDEELTQLRAEAENELAQMQELVARMGGKQMKPVQAKPVTVSPVADPISETDWGNGIGGREPEMSREDFQDELAEIRERSAAKRRRA